ncbi:HIT family protein, partial [Salmonella enterica subsp. enterica serovar Typhimurium]|uniref:HIT family protein n=2 Tax=Pseudomonadota TaxID=1224 RepID=UPI0021765D87
HTLVLPRRHKGSFFELEPPERDAVFELLDVARRDLDQSLHPDGYSIGINDGPAAGQTVPHLHVHLIPRYNGDLADPRGGV